MRWRPPLAQITPDQASLDPEAGGIEIFPVRMPEDWISIMPTLNGAASGLRWLEGSDRSAASLQSVGPI
jgi:hypothetical protein